MVLNLFDNPEFFLSFYDLSTLVLLQKRFTHFFCCKNYLCTFCDKKNLCTFFCRENNLRTFLLRKRFTHLVRKVFARGKLPSGKFRLFGPLDRDYVDVDGGCR